MEKFYKKRPLVEDCDYEQAYWGQTVDPDGVVRSKKDERAQYLKDISSELTYLNSQPGGKILDVGCGLGFLLSGVNDHFEKYGVEVSALATEHACQYGTVCNGTLDQAAYDDDFFDAVVMYHVIEHIDSPESVLLEIKRILKKNGVLIIATPDFGCICAKMFGQNFRMLHDKTHVSLFSFQSLKAFLKQHGFELENAEFPYFQSRHFNAESIKRMFDTTNMSPPFYGNVMTLYCRNNKD